jgi:hypothetical protein
VLRRQFAEAAQDPENLGARDLSQYDYVKQAKKVDGASWSVRRAFLMD